jgi:hypothetical protein
MKMISRPNSDESFIHVLNLALISIQSTVTLIRYRKKGERALMRFKIIQLR